MKGWGVLQKIPSNVQSMTPRPAVPSGTPGSRPAGLRADFATPGSAAL